MILQRFSLEKAVWLSVMIPCGKYMYEKTMAGTRVDEKVCDGL